MALPLELDVRDDLHQIVITFAPVPYSAKAARRPTPPGSPPPVPQEVQEPAALTQPHANPTPDEVQQQEEARKNYILALQNYSTRVLFVCSPGSCL